MVRALFSLATDENVKRARKLPRFLEPACVCMKQPHQLTAAGMTDDLIGMNHYTADYIRHCKGDPAPENFNGNLETLKENKAGESIGPETQSVWLRPNPVGFRKLINWISNRYGRPIIYVTENGTSLKGENDLPLDQLLDDEFRAKYFRDYITELAKAYAEDGVDVRGKFPASGCIHPACLICVVHQGYMAWSLME